MRVRSSVQVRRKARQCLNLLQRPDADPTWVHPSLWQLGSKPRNARRRVRCKFEFPLVWRYCCWYATSIRRSRTTDPKKNAALLRLFEARYSQMPPVQSVYNRQNLDEDRSNDLFGLGRVTVLGNGTCTMDLMPWGTYWSHREIGGCLSHILGQNQSILLGMAEKQSFREDSRL